MKTLYILIIVVMGITVIVSSFNIALAQNVTNSSNSILPIPSAILHSPVPTLSPSENQSVVNVALSISELQNWSHDWQYVTIGFGGNNKAASGDFEWQYASVVLKAPSSSAPFPCNNDWWATVVIDMTTMKVVSADYPTMKSHNCDIITIGTTTLGIPTKIDSPLKQFKSGIAAKDVKCNLGLWLVTKTNDGSPACVKPDTAQKLVERGWGTFAISSISGIDNQENNGTLSGYVFRVGGPRPESPQANYEVDVYATDGVTIVAKTLTDANAHYSITLPMGNYTIYVADYPTKQTQYVSVFSGKNTIFNILYGSGYK